MALVIFCVAFVEAMRTRMSLSEAIFPVHPGDPILGRTVNLSFVMPSLVPGIHVLYFIQA